MIVNILFLGAIFILTLYRRNKAQKMISDWAEVNNVKILEKEQRFIFCGPFTIINSGIHMIYLLKVEKYDTGEIKKIWMKIGSMFFGLLSEKIETLDD